MPRIARLAAFILVLAASPLGGIEAQTRPAPPAPGLKLERIVVVSRHGVRSPTRAPEALAQYASQPWPQWPVAPGELTDHGARDVRIMAGWLRQDYARRGLWPAKGCLAKGGVHVWADGHDQRTRLSGQGLLDGAFPGCGLKAEHGPEGEYDGLFSATDEGLCPIDADTARQAIVRQAGGDLDRPGAGYEAAKAALSQVLTAPGAPPCADEKGPCFLNGANRLRTTKTGAVALDGALASASTMSENLFLEYAQGMDAGWGRAKSEAALAAFMPLHSIEVDLARRTPYVAEHNGALVARAVLAALEGGSALPDHGFGAKLTAIAGHDTNLSNLAGVLDVDWVLAGQPDKTPPDAMLVFELWRGPTGQRVVRVALVYQTLDDLRAETPLSPGRPAGRIELPVDGCAAGPGGVCTLERFESFIEARLPKECVLPAAPAGKRRPSAGRD